MSRRDQLSITVVMPAYKAAHLLPRVLPPLFEMLHAGRVDEVLVIDDQSPDNTAQIARDMGATVLVTPRNGGPGLARNLAGEHAKGDVLWFVDSDVIAWPDGPERIRAAFAEGDDIGAVFGSYDDAPDGPSWFSRYKNLLHRHHHQRANREATTFWAGCGAVRADVYAEVGGFDVETYEIPSIEDIELGYRIIASGRRILVDPDFQGKHLKVWTVRGAIHTDIFCRALPWSRLMISREGLANDLNTSGAERLKALVAGAFLLSVLALPFAPGIWPVTLGLLALAFAGNLSFARLLYANGGLSLTVPGILFHQIYYVYSAATYVWCLAEYHLLGRKENLRVAKKPAPSRS